MPAYSFEALDAQGRSRKGVLEAETARAARTTLRGQGLVHSTSDGLHRLTPAGLHKREDLAQRAHRFTQERLQGAAPADIEATRRVLALLQDD